MLNPRQAISEVDFAFRVYGDNILECLHAVDWLNQSDSSGFIRIGQVGPIDRPICLYSDRLASSEIYAFQLCPYYGGTGAASLWANDPLAAIFNEKPDVAITRVREDNTETKPVLAMEFCDALQAGNQAWQRFRRAYDAAENGVPYFYVLPLIVWERQADGLSLKNARFQSAQITLAQLTLGSRFGVASLQVYTDTSWLDYARAQAVSLPENTERCLVEAQAVRYFGHLLRVAAGRERRGDGAMLTPIFEAMLAVADCYSNHQSTYLSVHAHHPALRDAASHRTAAAAYAQAVENGTEVSAPFALHTLGMDEFRQHGSLFKKDVQERSSTPQFVNGFLRWLNWNESASTSEQAIYLRKWGVPVGTADDKPRLKELALAHRHLVPVTYKAKKSEAALVGNRKALRVIVAECYPSVGREVLNWIHSRHAPDIPLLVVPLYGYKPSGDSRPDRGLLPCLAALFPRLAEARQMLVVMYSVNTPTNWREVLSGGGNELWNAVKRFAGAVIVDRTGTGTLL